MRHLKFHNSADWIHHTVKKLEAMCINYEGTGEELSHIAEVLQHLDQAERTLRFLAKTTEQE